MRRLQAGGACEASAARSVEAEIATVRNSSYSVLRSARRSGAGRPARLPVGTRPRNPLRCSAIVFDDRESGRSARVKYG
jgi:hypothetical protein